MHAYDTLHRGLTPGSASRLTLSASELSRPGLREASMRNPACRAQLALGVDAQPTKQHLTPHKLNEADL